MLKTLIPKLCYKRVFDIEPKALLKSGISGVLLDLDNTLVPHNHPEPTEEVILWLRRLKESGISVAIVSNNSKQRVEGFSKELSLPIIWRGMKPLPNGFLRGAKALSLPPEKVAIIGDQIFTDIVGGNIAGMLTILVEPIKPEQGIFFRLKRKLELPILAAYRREKDGRDTDGKS